MRYGSADRYYINPYEIAVQRGFRGSVDDWLASLKGDPGQGLAILGLYPTLEALQEAVATPKAGDCYAVGDADENTIYCYNGTAWQDIGPIKGDQGEMGPQGPQGIQGPDGAAATITVKSTTTGAPNSEAQVVNDGTANAAQLVFTIPRGAVGATGPTGPQGPKGDKGDKGDQGDTGATGATGPQGERGLQGPQGETGPQGEPGAKGDKGDKGDTGDNGATFTPAVSAEGIISWTNDKSLENPEPINIKGPKGETGPQGPKGDTGAGFLVLDYYATLDALEQAVPSPNVGDAYGVGSAEPYDIYIYGETSGWVNNGPLQGAKGDKGDTGATGPTGADGAPGEDGATFTPSVAANGDISWTNDKGLSNPTTVNIKGPKGDKGDKGDTGDAGPQGPQGNPGADGAPGAKGEDGDSGVYYGSTQPTDGSTVWIDPSGEADEVLPTVGGNGNWWVNGVDTGTKAQGETGATGAPGADGENGATFTPSVSAEGMLSWSNDQGLPNPASISIKGPAGADGQDGEDGAQGPAGPNEVSAATATSFNGLLKGNGSAVAQAVAGEDYALPQKAVSITLVASGWTGEGPYNQTIAAAGVTANNAVLPTPSPASWSAAGEAEIYCSAQAVNSLTFSAAQKPTIDLSYNVLIQEVIYG